MSIICLLRKVSIKGETQPIIHYVNFNFKY